MLESHRSLLDSTDPKAWGSKSKNSSQKTKREELVFLSMNSS